MRGRAWIVTGAVFGALGVSLGAFGAHGLKEMLDKLVPAATEMQVRAAARSLDDGSAAAEQKAPLTAAERDRELENRLGWFETAVRYEMYHAFALVLLGVVAARRPSKWLTISGALFVLGIALFSGLLVAMTFGGPRFLGAIVPIGGVAMILGWLAMAAGCWRGTTEASP
jgi:uncharacterized membrane protein YgdD (TMEM256/DUF423 family)